MLHSIKGLEFLMATECNIKHPHFRKTEIKVKRVRHILTVENYCTSHLKMITNSLFGFIFSPTGLPYANTAHTFCSSQITTKRQLVAQ